MRLIAAVAVFCAAWTGVAPPAQADPDARTFGAIVLGGGEVLSANPFPQGPTWGLGFGADREWMHLRASGTLFLGGGGSWSSSSARLSIDWLALTGSWSPVVGVSAGAAIIGKKRPYEHTGENVLPPYLELLPMMAFEAGAEFLRTTNKRLVITGELELPWSKPFRCSGASGPCDTVWVVRYPVLALNARLLLP